LKLQEHRKKDTGFAFASTVSFESNEPTAGQTTITLGNRDEGDHYFGEPRNFFRDRNRTFHVEKHGNLVCFTWNGVGNAPVFNKTVEINDGAADIEVDKNDDTGFVEYTVTSGNVNFIEAQRGDLFTIAGLSEAVNNGTFRVIGTSDDGTTIVVENTDGIDLPVESLLAGSMSVTAKVEEGDTVTIDAPFTTLNRGNFRVIRTYGNSFYIENENAVEENC
jgi:hypothetical protein